MKKTLLPFLMSLAFSTGFRQVHAQSLSTSPTLVFSNMVGFGDNIAQDGEGGSATITDINIQVMPINNVGTKLSADPLEYHGADWGTPSIITYGGVNPLYGWAIKSDNGADFSLVAFDLFDWGDWSGDNYTVEAFRNGLSLGTVNFPGNTNNNMIHLANTGVLTSIFQRVDEVRVHRQNGTNSWPSVNNIQVSSPVGALPLTWLRFSANAEDDGVLLTWSTAEERKVENFVVEHSEDGRGWSGIATISAAGNSSTVQEYRYLDRITLSSVHFYRIAELDIDGRRSYSDVLTVHPARAQGLLSVYPNPVTGGQITVAADGAEVIRMFNGSGGLVFEKQLQGGVQQLQLPLLEPGWYLLQAGAKSEKVLVQ